MWKKTVWPNFRCHPLAACVWKDWKIRGINAIRIVRTPTQSRTRNFINVTVWVSLFRKGLINSISFNVEMQKVKYSREKNIFEYKHSLHGSKLLVGQGLLIVEASRSNSDTPHTVGLPWTGYQPDTNSSTGQHTTLSNINPWPRPDSNSSPSKQVAKGPWLRPRGRWERRPYI
jgi:hypothetical protein